MKTGKDKGHVLNPKLVWFTFKRNCLLIVFTGFSEIHTRYEEANAEKIARASQSRKKASKAAFQLPSKPQSSELPLSKNKPSEKY